MALPKREDLSKFAKALLDDQAKEFKSLEQETLEDGELNKEMVFITIIIWKLYLIIA